MRPASALDPAPLAWVSAVEADPPYVNVGDALSPFMLAMVSGRPVVKRPFVDSGRRMAAIGTIGQSFAGGIVDLWGAGCSPYADPLKKTLRRPYAPPPGTTLRLHATRGPMAARLLSGGGAPDIPYGDPAALLPRFHAAPVAPRRELGAVLHLSELADRGFAARPKPALARYATPGDGSVRLITMVARPTLQGIREKIDEIRACRRIVSTSLHGLAIAAAYGIPCLYLGGDPGPDGMARAAIGDVAAPERVNARFVDLYGGYGLAEIAYWRQRRRRATDWEALIRAVDAEAAPLAIDAEALIAACPAGAAPLAPPPGGTIWEHPLIREIPIRGGAVATAAASGGIGARLGRLIGRRA